MYRVKKKKKKKKKKNRVIGRVKRNLDEKWKRKRYLWNGRRGCEGNQK